MPGGFGADRVVATGHRLSHVVTALLVALIVGITTIIFSATVGWTDALVVAAGAATTLICCWRRPPPSPSA